MARVERIGAIPKKQSKETSTPPHKNYKYHFRLPYFHPLRSAFCPFVVCYIILQFSPSYLLVLFISVVALSIKMAGEAPQQQERGLGGLFGKKKEEEGKQSDQYGQQCSDECGGQQQKKPGMVDKIKEKIPGQQQKIPGEGKECRSDQCGGGEVKKEGLVDKIKDKLPGNQNKNSGEEKRFNN